MPTAPKNKRKEWEKIVAKELNRQGPFGEFWKNEAFALEQCDKILEAVQDYNRGATKIKLIRQIIDERLKQIYSTEAEQFCAKLKTKPK